MYRVLRWPLVLAFALLATAYDTEVSALDTSSMPANGTYVINAAMDVRYVHALLQQVVVSANDVRFIVVYDNRGQLQYDIDCGVVAARPFVTFADGTTLSSLSSFCGQHPQATVAVGPRQRVTMSADFPRDARFATRFRFTWYYGACARNVSLRQPSAGRRSTHSRHGTVASAQRAVPAARETV